MYQRQQDASMREAFLMLAADTALQTGKADLSEQLRQEILTQNPHHILKPFAHFPEAARHPDVEGYLDDLRTKYPREVALDLLEAFQPGAPTAPPSDIPATLPPQPRPHGPLPPPLVPPTRAEAPEKPLKVYRHYEIDETQPPPTLPPQAARPRGQPRPAPAPAPAPAPRPAAPRQAPPPAPKPRAVPPPPRAAAPGTTVPLKPSAPAPEPEGDGSTAGSWVGTLLYLLVLAAGVALAMHALVPYELLQDL
jgi:hypothetical protein